MGMYVDLAKIAKEGTPADKTPEPFSASKTSNWVARAGGLPNYIQHVAHAFVRKGMDESKAIAMAVGVVRNWSEGKGGVSKAVQAAAAKAIAEWEAKKAATHAKGDGTDATYPFNVDEIDVEMSPDVFCLTTDLFAKETLTTEDLGGAGEAPLSREDGSVCPLCGGKDGKHKKDCDPFAEALGKAFNESLHPRSHGRFASKGGGGSSSRGGEAAEVARLHAAIRALRLGKRGRKEARRLARKTGSHVGRNPSGKRLLKLRAKASRDAGGHTPKGWGKRPSPAKFPLSKWNALPDARRIALMKDFTKAGGKLPSGRKFAEDGSILSPKKQPGAFKKKPHVGGSKKAR